MPFPRHRDTQHDYQKIHSANSLAGLEKEDAMNGYTVWPGRPTPLGATPNGEGVNFALFSENATRVELCLFDGTAPMNEIARIPLPEKTDQVWHGQIPIAKLDQVYGYRVYGPDEPTSGHCFNPGKVLLDPYAKSIARDLKWHPAINDPLLDSGPFAPLGRVSQVPFDWNGTPAPRIAWHNTVVYELHVKGFTKLHPEIPENLRGTYAGLGSEPAIKHLRSLGVTAVELMPVHYHIDDLSLIERGLTNYWGYNTLGYFAPDPRYCSTGTTNTVNEFKSMVRSLHTAGIEVILDVVYNHTAEGNQNGPILSFKGIDNSSYYRLLEDRRKYLDFTGCGNSLNVAHPRVLQLIMDSLRYWVLEMHVDGFRFDLASTLARELWEMDRLGAFFDIIHQDPILSQVKLIAEPWDLGPNGYQVGNFPVLWSEWNGKYRDCIRRFWKGDGGNVGELASRLSGSSDLYRHNGRRPYASLNFITCHDGFTLADLVSYNRKHNEANGENNRDGTDVNDSWNCGVEGPTNNAKIRSQRLRQCRNLLTTLILSQGVPMILAGDEMGRTQLGNNNAFCHDSPLSWLNWNLDSEENDHLEFVRNLLELRRLQPVFHRRNFFQGRAIHGTDSKDLYWLKPDGSEMSELDWASPNARCLGMGLLGDQIEENGDHGEPITGDSFLLLFNAEDAVVPFVLGARQRHVAWTLILDTSMPPTSFKLGVYSHMANFPLQARSIAILQPHYAPFA
jgi:glycogen operon protein